MLVSLENVLLKLLEKSWVLILLCLIVVISGCKIDGEEGIEIHADGAMTMRVNYQIPERGMSLEEGRALVDYLHDLCDRHESISAHELSFERAGSATVRLILEIHFTDAMQLRTIMAGEVERLEKEEPLDAELLVKLQAIIGDVTIGVEGLNIEFSRTIQLHDLLKSQLPNFNPDLLGKYQFRYSLTSPKPATTHNATTTSNNGKTLTWVMPLKQHFDHPFIMRATLPIPVPTWVWWAVCLALLVMLLILWKLFSYVRRKLSH